jgi:hypothetical protein
MDLFGKLCPERAEPERVFRLRRCEEPPRPYSSRLCFHQRLTSYPDA